MMISREIEDTIQTHVRPLLHAHGGDIELLSFEEGTLRFRLLGQCAGCPSADLTTQDLVKKEVTDRLPYIKDVILVNDVSDELMRQAHEILKERNEGKI